MLDKWPQPFEVAISFQPTLDLKEAAGAFDIDENGKASIQLNGERFANFNSRERSLALGHLLNHVIIEKRVGELKQERESR